MNINDPIVYYYPDDVIQLSSIQYMTKQQQKAISIIKQIWYYDNKKQLLNLNTRVKHVKYYFAYSCENNQSIGNFLKYYIKGIFICVSYNDDCFCEIQHYYDEFNISWWTYDFKKKLNGQEIILLKCIWFGDKNNYS